MPGTTVGEALSDAKRSIERRDAEYLLSHLLGTSRASIIAHSDRQIDPAAAARFRQWVAARADGKPVAQILGVREFYGRDFAIDEHVLIPRPETETLVEQALARISKQKSLKTPANRRLSILDLGTGSGIVAITVKLEAPDCEVVAVDASAAALRNARANAATLNAPVRFLDSNWYGALDGQCFDVIVSNPPYVAVDDPHLSRGDLRFEPMMALTDQSPDGLASIRAITAGALAHLRPNGWLMLEHGYNQAEAVRQLMGEARLTAVQSTRDLAGIERVTSGQRPA
ncbi:MAG: peptide chain release factor N(5)-glutamine methyltransferase [Betaproteobacteria bacterium]|jgi:release factor glutamine methyltransferase